MPRVAHLQGRLGFAASNEQHTLICIAHVPCPLPVESLLAGDVTEAGVPQSCRKTLLFCSSQVRQGGTSFLLVIMVNKHLLIGWESELRILSIKTTSCQAKQELFVSLKVSGKSCLCDEHLFVTEKSRTQGMMRPLMTRMCFKLRAMEFPTLQICWKSRWTICPFRIAAILDRLTVWLKFIISYWGQKNYLGTCPYQSVRLVHFRTWMCINVKKCKARLFWTVFWRKEGVKEIMHHWFALENGSLCSWVTLFFKEDIQTTELIHLHTFLPYLEVSHCWVLHYLRKGFYIKMSIHLLMKFHVLVVCFETEFPLHI